MARLKRLKGFMINIGSLLNVVAVDMIIKSDHALAIELLRR